MVRNSKYRNNQKFQKETPPGGLEPPTFRLTAERASQLRHGGRHERIVFELKLIDFFQEFI